MVFWLWKIYQPNSKDTIKSSLQNPILTLRNIGADGLAWYQKLKVK